MPATVASPPGASGIERFAAAELVRYVGALFGLRARIGAAVGPDDRQFAPGRDDALEEQELSLRRTGEHALRLAGGSGAAVLGAVCELVERWGVTSLPCGDVFPEDPGPPPFALLLDAASVGAGRARPWAPGVHPRPARAGSAPLPVPPHRPRSLDRRCCGSLAA